MRRKVWTACGGCLCLAIVALFAIQSAMAVEYANIDVVDGTDPIADPPNLTIPGGQGTAGFFLEPDPVTGLYPIRIGADATDDAANGVLLGYIRETGRDQLDGLGGTETLYATAATSRDGAGSLSLVVRRAGEAGPNSLYAAGSVFNANVAAAYFPFSEGWLAGTAYNEFNGSILNELVASGGMQLGTNFQQDFFGTGDHLVTLPGVTDTRRQGLLLVNGARDEGNYALSEPTADGSGFNVTGHDNAGDGSAGEIDPVSFVFLPLGTPNVTMARVHGGVGPNQQPYAMIQSGSNFTVSREDLGRYRLSIDGQTPSSGVLLVSPSGTSDGAGGFNVDNVVTYEADGNDWVILSQDLPALDGVGQDTGARAESYFSFAFLPFAGGPTSPGAIPSVDPMSERAFGWNTRVTATSNDNGYGKIGGVYLEVPTSSSATTVMPAVENRGDNSFAVDGAILGSGDGILFATVSEGLGDNSAVGGYYEYGVANVSTVFDDEWWVHTAVADPVLSPNEHNIDFSVAFFGADTGFQMAQGVATDEVAATAEIVIGGVHSLDDGVLIVNPAGNDDNFVTSAPRGDGSGWDVSIFDNSTTPEGGGDNEVNYIFLPFDAENLVAGRVGEDGTVAASTDSGEFTLVRDDAGEYLLTVNGKTPDDGMLLLTSTGEGDSIDNALAYETSGNSFRILGLDMITEDEANGGELVDLEDTSFVFAYVDFDAPPMIISAVFDADFDDNGIVDGDDFLIWQRGFGGAGDQFTGDANGDGVVDGDDFLRWQQDFGGPPSGNASAAVPEPAMSMLLLLSALAALALQRRQCRLGSRDLT